MGRDADQQNQRGAFSRGWGALIEEGQTILRQGVRRNRLGPYQLQAAINAVHVDAARVEATDWPQIVALYDQLLAVAPTPAPPPRPFAASPITSRRGQPG